ncbi:MAG: UDP-2,3-diacylglucosamine diphosphatase [Spirosomaceae bacterium]|jgi:UDP-2,3-diacylglucosamine hydrolase|nr:UDP-2,3-diacylglucosamine diphosphatase [Spirosomataceae bacterium]
MNRQIPQGKKIYFASDFHLGAPNHQKSHERERRIIRWLDSIRHDAEIIFLVGDLFDFWFEYKRTVPKGFVRFLGKLAEIRDSGIEIIVFTGNHDMWMDDYFETELNIKTYRKPQNFVFNEKKFHIAHGDGLGPGDYKYKVLKRIFEGKVPRFLFNRVMHPNLGLFLGSAWARHSWQSHDKETEIERFLGEEREFLILYSKEIESQNHHDFYIFGHRHLKLDFRINDSSRYINLGDWIVFNSYAVFDGEDVTLLEFKL